MSEREGGEAGRVSQSQEGIIEKKKLSNSIYETAFVDILSECIRQAGKAKERKEKKLLSVLLNPPYLLSIRSWLVQAEQAGWKAGSLSFALRVVDWGLGGYLSCRKEAVVCCTIDY